MKKNILLLLCVISTLSAKSQYLTADMQDSASQQARLSFGPMFMDFKAERGQSKTETFYIVNNKDIPYSFILSFQDFSFSGADSLSYSDPNTLKNSCADWITLDKEYVEVRPHTTQRVKVTMTVPDKPGIDELGRWTMLNVTMQRATETSKKGNVSLAVKPQILVGSQIYYHAPNAQKDIQLTAMEKMNDSTYRVKCNNTGKAIVKCDISMELKDVNSDYKTRLLISDKMVLPGYNRFFDITIPAKVPRGTYNAVAIVDAKDDDVPLEATQATIELK